MLKLKGSDAAFCTIEFEFGFQLIQLPQEQAMMSPILAVILEQTMPGFV